MRTCLLVALVTLSPSVTRPTAGPPDSVSFTSDPPAAIVAYGYLLEPPYVVTGFSADTLRVNGWPLSPARAYYARAKVLNRPRFDLRREVFVDDAPTQATSIERDQRQLAILSIVRAEYHGEMFVTDDVRTNIREQCRALPFVRTAFFLDNVTLGCAYVDHPDTVWFLLDSFPTAPMASTRLPQESFPTLASQIKDTIERGGIYAFGCDYGINCDSTCASHTLTVLGAPLDDLLDAEGAWRADGGLFVHRPFRLDVCIRRLREERNVVVKEQ